MKDEIELIPEQSPLPESEPTAAPERKQAPRLQPEAPAQADAAPAEPVLPERITVCDIQFRSGSKIYFFDPGELTLKNGDHVIIDTARGAEYGYCILGNHKVRSRDLVQPLRQVLRLATPADERIKAENERKEKAAFLFCQKKVEELGLDMQLVSAECAFDGSKLLFFFTADARVDFRELVKILAAAYHTRIELRQIGVRDKAKMFGGLGICGRPFCCASFLNDFEPVSIKMAKTQNLSLNPTKISGTCGRLMCCLKYEQDAYEDLIRTSPKADSFVDTPEGRGTVTAVNLMRQSVNVRMEKDPEEIHCFRNGEICVLRSGKAKKTDPPIPEDLAPISGRREADPLQRLSRVEQRLTLSAEEAERMSPPEPELPPFPETPEQPETEIQGKSEQRSRRHSQDRRRGDKSQQPAETQPQQPVKTSETERRGEGRKKERQEQPSKQSKLPAAQPAAETAVKARNKKPGQNRRRREDRKAQHKPTPQEAGFTPVQEPQVKAESAKKNNRRRYYRPRKPKAE